MRHPRIAAALVSAAALTGAACGGGGGNSLPTGPTPVSANVELELATSPEPGVGTSARADQGQTQAQSDHGTPLAECAGLVRLHPSWWSYAQVTMVATERDRFGLYFDQVPIGRHAVRLTVPDGCGSQELSANGVSLSADEEGKFTFIVNPDGSITR